MPPTPVDALDTRESATSRPGRHRAPATPGRGRRTVVAAVAAGAPLATGVLVAAPAAHAETDWDELAQCESGGDWSINTGNGFSGGLQFTPSTWKAFGGSGRAHDASRSEQIQVAERVKAEQGMNAWPTCSKKTGQTSSAPNSSVSSDSDSDSGSGSSSTKATSAPTKAAAPSGGNYTVKAGDTLSSIAAAHGKDWQSVRASNADVLTDPNMIFPGQVIDL